MYSFNDRLKEDEKEHNLSRGDDWFKFTEGENKLRILSESTFIAEHFKQGTCYGKDKGCPFHGENDEKASSKWLIWILDRTDNKIKLAKFPYKIIKGIGDLQTNEDYAFEDVPMPYDITINAKNAGTLTVEYSIIPSPKLIELTEDEASDLESKTNTEEIVEKMKEKQIEKNGEQVKVDTEFDEEEEEKEKF